MLKDKTARAGAAAAAIWLVSLAVVDALIAPTVILSNFFTLAPLMACAVLPPLATAGFSGATVALTVLSGAWNHVFGAPQQTIRVIDAILVSAAAVAIAAVRVRREQRFARVAAIAQAAQRAILPTLPSATAHLRVSARYLSAAEDAEVGGDLYDCYLSTAYTRFLIGDVRGKGIGAVEQAARVIRAFRQAAAIHEELPTVADDMSSYLEPFFGEEEFATALLIDVSDPRAITSTSCGHPPPVLVRRSEPPRFLDAPAGLPLGLGLGRDFLPSSVAWSPGDRVLMYTDGVSEARDALGHFLPLLDVAPRLATAPFDEALDELLAEIRKHVPRGDLGDDLAVVLLENVTSGAQSAVESTSS